MQRAGAITRSTMFRAIAPKRERGTRWRSCTGSERLDDLIARLNGLDSCAVSDALDSLGLPNGAVTGIHRLSSDRRIVGRVRTVKLDRADGRSSTRHLCTAAIEAASAGDLIVGEQPTGLGAAPWGSHPCVVAK